MPYFQPNYYKNKITDISVTFLMQQNIQGLILDIDNTLTTHGNPQPAEGIVEWIIHMKRNSIGLVLLSNNSRKRVLPFARQLNLPFISRGLKPLSSGFKRALIKLELQPQHVAVVGDQLYTDIWGGNRLGLKTILLHPILEESGPVFKCKRKLEKWHLRNHQW